MGFANTLRYCRTKFRAARPQLRQLSYILPFQHLVNRAGAQSLFIESCRPRRIRLRNPSCADFDDTLPKTLLKCLINHAAVVAGRERNERDGSENIISLSSG